MALVIGNSDYDASPLSNPVNDADDMETVLRKLKFTVIKGTNLNKRGMLNHLSRFSTASRQADVGLFFFGGHGIQFNNRNYLIPVGCTVADQTDVEFEGLDAGRVISKMESAGSRLNIVILDACRNNPFHRSFRSSAQGLARMDAPKGTIIAYATSPGSVASDDTGRNGTFTRHLLSAFTVPGLNIQDVFNQAGMGVMEETGDKQIPWVSNTPIPRYFLAGRSGGGDKIGPEPSPPVIPQPSPGDTWTEPVTGMVFVWVPEECFQMGQTQSEKDYLIKEYGQENYDKYCADEHPLAPGLHGRLLDGGKRGDPGSVCVVHPGNRIPDRCG